MLDTPISEGQVSPAGHNQTFSGGKNHMTATGLLLGGLHIFLVLSRDLVKQ